MLNTPGDYGTMGSMGDDDTAAGRRTTWVDVPENTRLSCGCLVIHDRLLVDEHCTSPIGHPTAVMRRNGPHLRP